ncbi:aldolase/citrate lyase family protein [Mesorhizobium sp. M0615]
MRFLTQIETPRALQRLAAIASAHPRMVAMALGPEDFSAAVGRCPRIRPSFDAEPSRAVCCPCGRVAPAWAS